MALARHCHPLKVFVLLFVRLPLPKVFHLWLLMPIVIVHAIAHAIALAIVVFGVAAAIDMVIIL